MSKIKDFDKPFKRRQKAAQKKREKAATQEPNLAERPDVIKRVLCFSCGESYDPVKFDQCPNKSTEVKTHD